MVAGRFHYTSMDAAVRQRLLARGIDPEASTTAFLAAIRAGAPLEGFGRSRGRSLWNDLRSKGLPLALPGLPMAMVLTDEEREAFLAARATYYQHGADEDSRPG